MAFPASYSIKPSHPSPVWQMTDGGFEATRRFLVNWADLDTFANDMMSSGLIPGTCSTPVTYPGTTITYLRSLELNEASYPACTHQTAGGTGLITNPATELEYYVGEVEVIAKYKSVDVNLLGDGANGLRAGTWVTYGRDVSAEFTTLPSRSLYWEGEEPADTEVACLKSSNGQCLFGEVTIQIGSGGATVLIAGGGLACEVIKFEGCETDFCTPLTLPQFRSRLETALGLSPGEAVIWWDIADGDVTLCFRIPRGSTVTWSEAPTGGTLSQQTFDGGRIKHDAHPAKVTPLGEITINWNFVEESTLCQLEKDHDQFIGTVNDAAYSFPAFPGTCTGAFEPETLLYMGYSVVEDFSVNKITTFCSGLSARRSLQLHFKKRRISGYDAVSGNPLIAGWNHFLYDKANSVENGYKRIVDRNGNPTYELRDFSGLFA